MSLLIYWVDVRKEVRILLEPGVFDENGFYTKEHISRIKNLKFLEKEPFFAGNVDETVHVWGNFSDSTPMVTILLPTCNRPELFQIALNSALNQKKFDDYEIIVVDNGLEREQGISETQRIIEKTNSEKVIYYKNTVDPTPSRMDRCVSLARTKWIVFLHDDDTLHPYHLKIMTDIVSKHTEIDYLSCRVLFVEGEEYDHCVNDSTHNWLDEQYVCRSVDVREYVYLDNSNWLGALIDREKYIDCGGMGRTHFMMNDSVMSARFGYHYPRYYIHIPLYLYRMHSEQQWGDSKKVCMALIAQYFYYCNATETILGRLNSVRERFCRQRIFEYIKRLANGYWHQRFDINFFCENIDKPYFDPDNSFSGRVFGVLSRQWDRYVFKFRNKTTQFNVMINENDGDLFIKID